MTNSVAKPEGGVTGSKRVLITGATGFIGGHILDEALRLGWEVWVALRPQSDSRRIEERGVRTIVLDYAREEAMDRELAGLHREEGEPLWDYVIHNAGLTKTPHPSDFREANAENTRRLCASLRRAHAVGQSFVLVSSLSVYGAPKTVDGVICSTDMEEPHTEYGKSKQLAESYVRESGVPYTILQPTGVYGVGDEDYLMALKGAASWANVAAGLAPQHLTFVYASDVARAACFLAQEPRSLGGQYIISDGHSYTDTEFGLLAGQLLGKGKVRQFRIPLPIVWVVCQMGGVIARIKGKPVTLNPDKYPLIAQRSWLCDAEPLFALGFRPEIDLAEGLRRTIAWGRERGVL